jgi:hypothetical protein
LCEQKHATCGHVEHAASQLTRPGNDPTLAAGRGLGGRGQVSRAGHIVKLALSLLVGYENCILDLGRRTNSGGVIDVVI